MAGTRHITRIGILSPATEPGMRHWWKELEHGLKELGYVESSNVELIWRFADGRFERLPELAAELAKLEVDIIMPATPPAIRAAKSACGNIPIVFPLGSDPVETGLVANLERPGGNVTGMATMSWRQCRPRLGFVRDIIPNARRMASIYHSANAALQLQVEEYVWPLMTWDWNSLRLIFPPLKRLRRRSKSRPRTKLTHCCRCLTRWLSTTQG